MQVDVASVGALLRSFHAVRRHSTALAAHLSAEDQLVQSMPDTSPTKWHLGHTTWFFETVILKPWLPGYAPFSDSFDYLFNSYYETIGARQPRPLRGLLSRPSLAEVHAYRRYVDDAVNHLFAVISGEQADSLRALLELGIHHEQQHQELILSDILHALASNPLLEPYREDYQTPVASAASTMEWLVNQGGRFTIGHQGNGFAFDNEGPAHDVLLQPHAIASRLVTNQEFAKFIEDGGYLRPSLWLSAGWSFAQSLPSQAPLYWVTGTDWRVKRHFPEAKAGEWYVFGLNGLHPVDPLAPVSNVSFYEAAAFAEWAEARLPTEAEWESAAALPAMRQTTGQVWQWTRSSYDPYPGFRPPPGVVAEYNGKFMVGQMVLRGGSAATPPGHARLTYRNFFPPDARWQFTGIRLARDL